LSVNDNLTNNKLHGGTLTTGTIVIVPAAPNTTPAPAGSSAGCDPGGAIANIATISDLAVWGTHAQDSGAITESSTAHIFGWLYTFGAAYATLCHIETELASGGSGQGLCNCASQNQASADPGVDPPIIGTVTVPTSVTKLPALP